MARIKRYFIGQVLAFAYFAVGVVAGGYVLSEIMMYFRPDISSALYGQVIATLLSFVLAGFIATNHMSSVKPWLGQIATATAAIICALVWVSIKWVATTQTLYVLTVLIGICFSFIGNQICARKNKAY